MEQHSIQSKFVLEKLSVDKKVIPLYFNNGGIWHTDIKLPDIILNNRSDAQVKLEGISIAGFTGEKEVVRFHKDGESIAPIHQENSKLLNKLLNSTSQWAAYNLGMLYGKITAGQTAFAESTTLDIHAAACLRLSDLFICHYAGEQKIDQVLLQITLSIGNASETVDFTIELTRYECKGEYIFPIKGRCTVVGTPWNRVMGHRLAASQEFAFDVVDYRAFGEGGFALSSPPNSNTVKDYYFFEREVLAVGDGRVVAAGNQWPNAWAENPLINPDDRIIEQSEKLLDAGVDFPHVILGNYAIIDHMNGEYSVYAHMSEGTVTVQAGDEVEQGQVIGKIGNTSNSDHPHLHFHLMDSPDFITANGLPITFTNLPNSQPPFYDFGQTNSLLYSDYLFLNISEFDKILTA